MSKLESSKFNKTGQRIDNLKSGILGHQGDCIFRTVSELPSDIKKTSFSSLNGVKMVPVLQGESGHTHGLYKINDDGDLLDLEDGDIAVYETEEKEGIKNIYVKASNDNICLLHEEHTGLRLVPNKIYKYEPQIIPVNTMIRRVAD